MKSNQFNQNFALLFVRNKSYNLITETRETEFENEM